MRSCVCCGRQFDANTWLRCSTLDCEPEGYLHYKRALAVDRKVATGLRRRGVYWATHLKFAGAKPYFHGALCDSLSDVLARLPDIEQAGMVLDLLTVAALRVDGTRRCTATEMAALLSGAMSPEARALLTAAQLGADVSAQAAALYRRERRVYNRRGRESLDKRLAELALGLGRGVGGR
jgi:hypothetical protein